MAMIPENPVVGGEVLRRAAIMSPNFVHNVSGWTINQDGSAEFNNVVIRNGQVVSGTALFYNGTPAAGNLVASISAAAGTDSFGNAYIAGIASYNTTNGLQAQLNNGAATFPDAQSADVQTFVSAIGALHVSASGQTPITVLNSGATDAAGSHSTIWLSGEPLGGGNPQTITLFAANAAGTVLTDTRVDVLAALIFGTTSGGLPSPVGPVLSRGGTATLVISGATGATAVTTALLEGHGGTGQTVAELIADAAATLALAARVSGDTQDRLKATAAGVISWGTGAAGTDTSVQRSAAGVLQVLSTFVTTVGGVAETWHTLGTLAGYTVTVGLFRLDVLGNLELDIVVVAGGANAVSTTFSVTLPAAYRPVNQKEIPAATSTNIAAGVTQPRVVIATTGTVTVQLAANSTSTLYMSGMVPLN